MKISVDTDRCVGAGQCVMSAADVFDQDDDEGLVVLLDAEPSDERRDVVEEAVRLCPAQAIQIVAE